MIKKSALPAFHFCRRRGDRYNDMGAQSTGGRKEDLMISILIVEDDGDLNRSLCRFLSGEGYSPQGVRTGQEGINALYAKHFDMIISDIMMPGMDGFAFARTIREQDRYIPILFMTARDDFLSKEKGYDLGVDDYLVKPVDFRELQLHIRALLRRARIMESRRITIGNLVLDEDSTSAEVDGKPVSLTLREFQILYKLLSYPNRTFTRSQLLDDFSGLERENSLRTVDVHLTNPTASHGGCGNTAPSA